MAVATTAREQATWYALDAAEVAAQLGVDATRVCPRPRRRRAASSTGRTSSPKPSRSRAGTRSSANTRDLMQVVLLVVGIGSLWPLQQWGTGIVVLLLTVFNAVLGLRQEGKAAAAVAALQKMMIVKARVMRDGALAELPAEELVPGDVVSIEAGDVVSADGRLITVATLEVAESALTGESLPVGKTVEAVAGEDTPLGDRTDMVYMNTNITRGSGQFVVTSTGMATEVGHISNMLAAQDESREPLTKQLTKLTVQIVVIAGAALGLSMVINLSRGETFHTVFTAAIAFAIAAIPTGLPAVVTTILSMGTTLLAKANAIVKRLRSTETLGATSAINSDKTGTLTLNQMTAVEMTTAGRRYTISGNGYETEGVIKRSAESPRCRSTSSSCRWCSRRRRRARRRDDRGSDRRRARRPGREGRDRRPADARAVPARRGAALRRGVQADGDLPPDGRRVRAGRGARFRERRPRPAPRPQRRHPRCRPEGGRPERRLSQPLQRRERAPCRAGPARAGDGRKDFDPEAFAPGSDLLALIDGMTLLSLVGIVDPPRTTAKAAIETAKAPGSGCG